MLENMMRRRISLVLLIGLAVISGYFWSQIDADKLDDGIYHATAKGFAGDLEIAVTMSGGDISAIDVVNHNDTPFMAQPVFDQVIPAIIAAQSPEVDALTGATYTSEAVKDAVRQVLSGSGELQN